MPILQLKSRALAWGRETHIGVRRSGRELAPAARVGSVATGRRAVLLQELAIHSASVGDFNTCTLSFTRSLMKTRFLASTITAPTPSSDSTNFSPRSGPRMKTASSIPSAVVASGAQIVTLRHAVAGYPVFGSMMWW